MVGHKLSTIDTWFIYILGVNQVHLKIKQTLVVPRDRFKFYEGGLTS